MLNEAIPEEALTYASVWDGYAGQALTDFYLIAPEHRQAVSNLVSLDIIRGKADGTFGGGDALMRCDGSVLLVRTVEAVDSTRYRQPMQLNITFVDEDGDFVSSAAVINTRGESNYKNKK